MIQLRENQFSHRWPRAPHSLTEGMIAASEATFARYGIVTPEDAADFMAQVSEETGAGTALEENLNYTPERLCEVWPSRFPTFAAAAPYAHNPRALADDVYGDRYGNRPGTDDGWNFRGRGLIQVTFRDWYAKLTTASGIDLINTPDLVCDPRYALSVACAFWKVDGISALANAGEFRSETLRLNGGYTNLAIREQWRAIWRVEFGLPAYASVPVAPHLPS